MTAAATITPKRVAADEPRCRAQRTAAPTAVVR
jgi:hypothetical protein